MKKKERGFTLAELLIVLAIISIITTAGFTIANKSIKNAYNEYFYKGYTTITNLLLEADYKEQKETRPAGFYALTTGNFYNNIASRYLSLANSSTFPVHIVTTSNIIYDLNGPNDFFMTVPQAKSSEFPGGTATIRFHYDKTVSPYPIPFGNNPVNLSERIDLLPCYIKDGQQGTFEVCADGESNDGNANPHYVACQQGGNAYNKPNFMTLRQALCTTVNDDTQNKVAYRNALNCNIPPQGPLLEMPLEFVPPRKAHH